jgi:hypothetical protein
MKLTKAQKRLQVIAETGRTLADEALHIAEEMQAYWDERSEKWQEGDKGTEFDDHRCTVEEWADEISQAADSMPEIA